MSPEARPLAPVTDSPSNDHYDVVIVGGAIIGSSIAWFLSQHYDFDGSILVVERDMTFANSSTAHTNSCMRQQFSNPLNVKISQYAAEFVREFKELVGPDDPEVHEIAVDHFGYMYLASDDQFADTLRTNQLLQADAGAGTQIYTPEQIKAEYPYYNVDDLVCGSHNKIDEGYFDSGTMFDTWRRKAREAGVEYTKGEVVSIERSGDRIESVTLASGRTLPCGAVVNAAGPRASTVAAMAGFELPVEPRKRFTFMVDVAEPLEGKRLPLTIDPSGVHVRPEGTSYMTGCSPDPDPAVDPDDFSMDDDIFEEKVWPALAHRIPAFERIKVVTRWAGHYAYNRLDHNVIVGPHHEVGNFLFANGFSGHGLQQSPAVGRGVAEQLVFGRYETLDLSQLGYKRVVDAQAFVETAVI